MWMGASESVCMAGASLPKSMGRLCGSVPLWAMSDIRIGEVLSPHSLPNGTLRLIN